MFSTSKIKKFLTKRQEVLSENVTYVNQPQRVALFNKKSNIAIRSAMNKPTGKAFVIQEPEYNNENINDDGLNKRRTYTDDGASRMDGNNFDTAIGSGVVRSIKSQIPIEKMHLNASVFSVFKPNKNYAFETQQVEAEEEEEQKEFKNSVDDTFQRAVSPIIFLGQCFALMPVKGVLQSNPKRLKFSFKSLQMLYTIFFMCSSTILTMTTLKHLLKVGINAKNFVGVVFFSCVQFCCLLFASLATRWPKMMRYWYRVETTFTQKPYETPRRNLAKRVQFAAVVIIFLSALEHGLYLSSAIISYRIYTQQCASVFNTTGEVSISDYIQRNYEYVFEILPYNTFVTVFILVVNGACTFIWNYMDLFIMMVSKGIAYRFEQITTRINKLANKDVPETVFIEIREHYVKLCELLEYIDENLSGIILLSCINNLYFVCYQLLNIFNKLRWPINYIYFWYSLLYLIGRTAFVFLSAASINDESKGGLAVLRRVSTKTWCVEIERLIFQMTTQTVALSGKKFYYLTRRLLFGMAGTIVTYELVLLQFDEPNRAKGLSPLCG